MNVFHLSNCRAPGRSRLARRDAWRRRRRPMGVPIIGRAAPTDAQAIVQARVDAWRTTYKGMISDAYLAAMKVEESAALWERILTAGATKTSVYVAEDGGEVVAFASGLMLAEPKFGLDAELSPIYLRWNRQRTGNGAAARRGGRQWPARPWRERTIDVGHRGEQGSARIL